jgi:hypothetical protein
MKGFGIGESANADGIAGSGHEIYYTTPKEGSGVVNGSGKIGAT